MKQFCVKGWFDNGFGKYPNTDPEPPIAELHPKVPESCCDPSKDIPAQVQQNGLKLIDVDRRVAGTVALIQVAKA